MNRRVMKVLFPERTLPQSVQPSWLAAWILRRCSLTLVLLSAFSAVLCPSVLRSGRALSFCLTPAAAAP